MKLGTMNVTGKSDQNSNATIELSDDNALMVALRCRDKALARIDALIAGNHTLDLLDGQVVSALAQVVIATDVILPRKR